MINKAIYSLLFPLIVFYLSYHYLTKEPDITYSISPSVPIAKESELFAHQLIVENNGDKVANNIKVHINSDIRAYDVERNSIFDSFSYNVNDKGSDILYAELPPKGRFFIHFNDARPLNSKDISVHHNDGVGILDEPLIKPYQIPMYIGVLYWLVFILWLVSDLRRSKIQDLERVYNYDDAKEILCKTKPWYVKKKMWLKTRETITKKIISFIREEYLGKDVNHILAFRILNSMLPAGFTAEEQSEIIEVSEKKLEAFINEMAIGSFDNSRILQTLCISNPLNLSPAKWNKWLIKAEACWLDNETKFIKFYNSTTYEKLKEPKPAQISEETWQKYLKICRSFYFVYLCRVVFFSKKPLIELEKEDISMLGQEEGDLLKTIAYLNQIILLKQTIIDGKVTALGNDVTWLKKDDLSDLEELVFKISKTNECDLIKCNLELEKKNLDDFISKIKGQLSTIRLVFDDPCRFVSLEDFEIPFTEGNREVLRKIAVLAKQSK